MPIDDIKFYDLLNTKVIIKAYPEMIIQVSVYLASSHIGKRGDIVIYNNQSIVSTSYSKYDNLW